MDGAVNGDDAGSVAEYRFGAARRARLYANLMREATRLSRIIWKYDDPRTDSVTRESTPRINLFQRFADVRPGYRNKLGILLHSRRSQNGLRIRYDVERYRLRKVAPRVIAQRHIAIQNPQRNDLPGYRHFCRSVIRRVGTRITYPELTPLSQDPVKRIRGEQCRVARRLRLGYNRAIVAIDHITPHRRARAVAYHWSLCDV